MGEFAQYALQDALDGEMHRLEERDFGISEEVEDLELDRDRFERLRDFHKLHPLRPSPDPVLMEIGDFVGFPPFP